MEAPFFCCPLIRHEKAATRAAYLTSGRWTGSGTLFSLDTSGAVNARGCA